MFHTWLSKTLLSFFFLVLIIQNEVFFVGNPQLRLKTLYTLCFSWGSTVTLWNTRTSNSHCLSKVDNCKCLQLVPEGLEQYYHPALEGAGRTGNIWTDLESLCMDEHLKSNPLPTILCKNSWQNNGHDFLFVLSIILELYNLYECVVLSAAMWFIILTLLLAVFKLYI